MGPRQNSLEEDKHVSGMANAFLTPCLRVANVFDVQGDSYDSGHANAHITSSCRCVIVFINALTLWRYNAIMK
jgi:hypothetical protein